MKKRILRITILLLIITAVFYFNGGLEKLLKSPTVQAVGDLIVDFHVPPGNPIFVINNMAPGDHEARDVDVTNNETVPRFVAVKGFRTGGVGSDPKIETELDLVIKEGLNVKYGPAKLTDFFSISGPSENGVMLDLFNPTDHRTYTFDVTFPASADDRFQAKSVTADLSFGIITSDNLVINEVYYNPKLLFLFSDLIDRFDQDHWEDRFIKLEKKRIFRRQWIELYNPTDHDISLKNWSLTDNSGKKTIIHANKKIKAGGFVLISKSAFLWWFYRPLKYSNYVEIGRFIGNGLDVEGDRLILKDSKGKEVDRMSWGGNYSSDFTPPAVNPKVDKGHSTERQAPGFDTDAASDWLDRNPPTPGN